LKKIMFYLIITLIISLISLKVKSGFIRLRSKATLLTLPPIRRAGRRINSGFKNP